MALQRLKEAAERAKKDLSQADDDRHQPAVHHRRCQRAQAPADVDHAVEVRAAGRSPDRALPRAGAEGLAGRRLQAERHRRDRAGRRHDAACRGSSSWSRRSSARKATGRQPRRGGRRRRRHPGAQLLLGSKADVLLLDVTPLSLGIETTGRRHHQADRAQHHHPDDEEGDLLHGGGQPDGGHRAGLPGRKPDGQQPGNRLLGQFNLEGIPPAPRGMPQIEVTFDIDHNGILNVSAKDWAPARSRRSTSSRPAASARPRSSGCARRPSRTPRRIAASAS